jgi:hypothetical protein
MKAKEKTAIGSLVDYILSGMPPTQLQKGS